MYRQQFLMISLQKESTWWTALGGFVVQSLVFIKLHLHYDILYDELYAWKYERLSYSKLCWIPSLLEISGLATPTLP